MPCYCPPHNGAGIVIRFFESEVEAKVGDGITAKLGDTYFGDVDTTLYLSCTHTPILL